MLHVKILGGLQLTIDGQVVSGFISNKAQGIFYYLLLNRNQVHLRSTLAALFWGEMPDEDAATNLRQAIANLKRLFEPYLDITRHSVAVLAECPLWIDAEAFVQSGDPTLYQGELLKGFSVAECPEFEEWLTTERERFHLLARQCLHKTAQAQIAAGEMPAAIMTLHRALNLDPLQEEFQRQLMLALALDGQRGAALSQFEACRTLLRRELAVEPEVATVRLFQRIRAAQRLHELPAETTPFVGREAEMRELSIRLVDPSCHLITIIGLGGIGKTRLALRAAHRHVQRMLHGAVMVNLTAIETLPQFFSMLAEMLGCSPTGEGGIRAHLLNFLREKHILLLLDNFEQLIGQATEFLTEVIRLAPEVKLMVTSRERLNVRGEWALALQGLPFADDSQPSDQAPMAQTLFWTTARLVRGDDLLTNQERDAVTRICRLVDGMPLAIELAAAWSRLLTCEELASEIASHLMSLETSARDSDERHRSLRAVFDQSWALFTAQERHVLMALAIFPTSFTRKAAEQVARATLPMLFSLVDKMLLRREANQRFSLHDMVRQYLYENLTRGTDFEVVRDAFIAYFVQFMEAREQRLKSSAQLEALNDLEHEIESIHLTWRLAVEKCDAVTIVRLLPGLVTFHDCKSHWALGESLLLSAEAVVKPVDDTTYGMWLSYLAFIYARQDRVQDLEQYANRCLELLSSDQLAHQSSIARTLSALGHLERLRGNYPAAAQYFQQALDIRTALHDEWGRAECYLNLGSVYGRHGQDGEATRFTQQGLEISRVVGDIYQLSRLQILQAVLLERANDFVTAEHLYRSTLTSFEAISSAEGRALCYSGLGNLAYFRHSYPEAQQWYLEALTLYQQLGTREWEGGTLNNLGELARTMGDFGLALDLFRQSLSVFRDIGHHQFVELVQQEIDKTLPYLHKSQGAGH